MWEEGKCGVKGKVRLYLCVQCIKIEEAPVTVSQEEEASPREEVPGDGR